MGLVEIRFRPTSRPPTVEHVEIHPVDLGNPHVADAWYEVYESADRFGRPHAVPWLRPEISEQYTSNARREAGSFAGLVDGRIVAVGTIDMPLLDNTHYASVGVYVSPKDRRVGHGSAMLAHLERVARDAGRRTAFLEANYPLDSPVDGKGTAPADFATSQGYSFGLSSIMRVMPLPLDADRLAALSDEAAAHHRGYRVEVFAGRIPDRWVADYVALDARIASESPAGELELEAGSTAVEPFRDSEEKIARQGRLSYTAVALHGEEVVAFSTAAVARSDRTRAYQWGTLVSREHRGHRLGLAVKVANVRQLRELEPALRSIQTWNAEANGPMITVNDQLGYVPVERLGEFQKNW